MLSALDMASGTRLSLPDIRSRGELEMVRARARGEELCCPVCRQALWLHAGPRRIAYFAHRKLNDCPQSRTSEAVLAARSQIYQFFQERLALGRLQGSVELEPAPTLTAGHVVDLLLKRAHQPPVPIVLLESGLKRELRWALPLDLEEAGLIFRPVFLRSRLKELPAGRGLFVLDTTQRELSQDSPYGLTDDWRDEGATLRFIDPARAEWTSLRALRIAEPPQVYRALVHSTPLKELLWSERYSDWAHPGEAEALKAKQEQAKQKHQAEARRPTAPLTPAPQVPVAEEDDAECPSPPHEPGSSRRQEAPSEIAGPKFEPPDVGCYGEESHPEPPDDSFPAWLRGGLRCIGCGSRTNDWQNAVPAHDTCVCRACFKRGVRLESS